EHPDVHVTGAHGDRMLLDIQSQPYLLGVACGALGCRIAVMNDLLKFVIGDRAGDHFAMKGALTKKPAANPGVRFPTGGDQHFAEGADKNHVGELPRNREPRSAIDACEGSFHCRFPSGQRVLTAAGAAGRLRSKLRLASAAPGPGSSSSASRSRTWRPYHVANTPDPSMESILPKGSLSPVCTTRLPPELIRRDALKCPSNPRRARTVGGGSEMMAGALVLPLTGRGALWS